MEAVLLCLGVKILWHVTVMLELLSHVVVVNPTLSSCYDLLLGCFVIVSFFKELQANVQSIFLLLFGHQVDNELY